MGEYWFIISLAVLVPIILTCVRIYRSGPRSKERIRQVTMATLEVLEGNPEMSYWSLEEEVDYELKGRLRNLLLFTTSFSTLLEQLRDKGFIGYEERKEIEPGDAPRWISYYHILPEGEDHLLQIQQEAEGEPLTA